MDLFTDLRTLYIEKIEFRSKDFEYVIPDLDSISSTDKVRRSVK